jgi:hypothetical protein
MDVLLEELNESGYYAYSGYITILTNGKFQSHYKQPRDQYSGDVTFCQKESFKGS